MNNVDTARMAAGDDGAEVSPQIVALRAELSALAADERARILARVPLATRATGDDLLSASVRESTRGIIERVRRDGDAALRDMARRFDGVELDALEVPRARWREALDALDTPTRAAMERAARNIATVHRASMPQAIEVSPEPGVVIGRRPDPLSRVGVYAPGGRAAYPSSLLMGAIPARTAGVGEVIVCSPPSPNGFPTAVVLAAAELANVDRVFALGGAGAVAAMALGTASVPRVDRIVGPGNAYVAEAKLQLVDAVAIDAPAGPSELLVLADGDTPARTIAHELLAQAEHDPEAAVIAVVVGEDAMPVLNAVVAALDALLADAPRADIAREALLRRGVLLATSSLDDAIAFANAWAPEHLLLSFDDVTAPRVLDAVRNAGTVFLGAGGSVAFGDYLTGANHVLPTAGLARSYSGLSTLDFVRWTTWQRIDADAAVAMAIDTETFARSESLPAHAAAARDAATRRNGGAAT